MTTNEFWEKTKVACERKYVRAMKRIGKIVGWTLLAALGVGLLALLTIQFVIPSFVVDKYRYAEYNQAEVALRDQAQATMDRAAMWVGRIILWPIAVAWVIVIVGAGAFGGAVVIAYGFHWLFVQCPIFLCAHWNVRKAQQRRVKRP